MVIEFETISPREAQKLANALRSGKYKQSKGCLQNKSGHCCLGVSCEIFIPKRKQLRDTNTDFLIGSLPSHQSEAPQWLKKLNYHFSEKAGVTLAMLNDGGLVESEFKTSKGVYKQDELSSFTFDEIADLIELVFVHKMLD